MGEQGEDLQRFPGDAGQLHMDWLIGSSEMADRIRSMDWACTSLGAREQWPSSLRTMVNLVVASQMPMLVMWGSQFITLYNDSCREIFAERHPGALGRPTPEVWPEAWPAAEPRVAAILGRGESFDRKNACYPLIRRGRREDAYFTIAATPIRADDGSIGGVLAVFHETTADILRVRELEQAQEADRATRAKLEAALASIADAICIVDTQGRLLDCNEAFASFHNVSREQARNIKMTVEEYTRHFEILFPDGTLMPLDQWAVPRALRGETVANAECTLRRRRNGEVRIMCFNFAPICNTQGEIVGAVVTGRDITEQKRAEEALRASEAKYASIFEKSPFALAISSRPNGMFTAVNDAFLHLFEYSRDEVIGKNSAELGMASDDARDRLRDEFLARGSVHDYECIRYSKYGRKRHVSLHLDWVRVGDKSHVLVTMQDISARKEAEEAKRLYQETKELDELKTRFFSSISHEFRTPLSLILGPTEHILQDTSTPESTRKHLALIARNARTLLGYVNNLLDVAKLEAGRMIVEYIPADLVHLVRVAASHFEVLAADHHFSFEVQAPERLPVEIDAEKVQRIVMNLLSNAFKFTPAGGRVRVTVKEIPERVRIEVADSGPGIPPDRREKLFERFGTDMAGATGLGLSIVREFTVLHGGTIALSDAPEGGALFAIELPRKAQPEAMVRPAANESFAVGDDHPAPQSTNHADRSPSQPRAHACTTGPLVLVIEDNADMNAFIVDTLANQYRVQSAFDGREGLKKALELEPDLILCDLMMPGMTGEEFVHEARQISVLATTPIVVVSARADDLIRVQLLRGGVQDYLTKPFGVEELRARVGNLVSKRIAERALQSTEAKYRGIIAISADAIVTINARHEIVEWNDGAAKIFGYARAEIIGQPLVTLLPPRFRNIHRAHITRFAMEAGSARRMDHSTTLGLRKNGEEFPIAVTISRLELDGELLMTAAVRDISEERRIEQELRLAIRTRDEVLSVVAHDLRNPLGVILIETAMLNRMCTSADARMKRITDSIDRSAQRMGRIIEDLLDVARCKLGQLSIDPQPHSLDEIISTAVGSQRSLLSHAFLTIRLDVAADLPAVNVDRDRFVQVLVNLLGNAIKFSHRGQTVVVGAKQTGNDVLVWVQDQGIGIAPDALPHVFDRFWHGDTRHGGGTGLGLAIVKGIVETHGGRVWAESALGAGSTFYFTIPVVRQDAPPPTPPTS